MKLNISERRANKKEYNRKWQIENRERRTEYYRKYRQTLKGKEAVLRAIKKYEVSHPERKKAWGLCMLYPKKVCIKCGVMPTHKHHPNILKPLEIVYLCPLHHKEAHR